MSRGRYGKSLGNPSSVKAIGIELGDGPAAGDVDDGQVDQMRDKPRRSGRGLSRIWSGLASLNVPLGRINEESHGNKKARISGLCGAGGLDAPHGGVSHRFDIPPIIIRATRYPWLRHEQRLIPAFTADHIQRVMCCVE